jgi:hypothetical protein
MSSPLQRELTAGKEPFDGGETQAERAGYCGTTHAHQNGWSLGYLTIVGAYVLKGDRSSTRS